MKKEKKCKQCGRLFEKSYYTSNKRWAEQKFCSTTCSSENWTGHTPPKSAFKKGMTPWNKGKKHSANTIKKLIVINNENRRFGSKHHLWKAEKASYAAIHIWVNAHKIKPKNCTSCDSLGNSRQIQWSNIDHKYKRNLDDYTALCSSCHQKYDRKNLSHKSPKQ